ncbi:MAG: ABC transporter permease [Actinomycetota bacterium]
MTRYILGRIATLVPMLLVVCALTFALLDLAPGDPALRIATSLAGGPPDLSRVEDLRVELGLDDPLPVRFGRWLGDVVQGDFGRSAIDGSPVTERVVGALGPTLLLTGSGLLVSVLGGLLLGTTVGLLPDRGPARLVRGGIMAMTGVSFVVPTFLVALGGLWLFAVILGWFPAGGISDPGEPRTIASTLEHLILPAVILGVGTNLGVFTRLIAAGVEEQMDAEFVRNARSRSIGPRRIVSAHVVRTSIIPLVAQVGSSMAYLVGGAYAVEVVFGWPGLGRLAVEAAQDQDVTVILAVTVISGLVVVAGNLAADVLLGVIDPRVLIARRTT